MALSRARLDEWRREVDGLAVKAADYVGALMEVQAAEAPSAPVAERREAALEYIDSALYAFGDQAGELACDLYDELALASGAASRAELVSDVVDWGKVESKVRWLAQNLVEGEPGKFERGVTDLTRYCVKRSAFENMERNCERNDVRYARVTSGTETCPFCFMLSSRGFVYRSERTAEGLHGYHDRCDCVAVPGFEGLGQDGQVEGYRPDEMYGRWSQCEKALGGSKQIREGWNALSKAEKSKYKGESLGEKWRRYYVDRVNSEVSTRDWKWLYTGEEPKTDYSRCPRSEYGTWKSGAIGYDPDDFATRGTEWRDLFAHDSLKRNGFPVAMRSQKAIGQDGKVMKGVSTPDIEIGGVIVEVKSPKEPKDPATPKNRLRFIESALRSAKRNFSNVYDEESRSAYGDMTSQIRVVLNTKYRLPGEDTGEDVAAEIVRMMRTHRIKEVIHVRSDGSVRRYK